MLPSNWPPPTAFFQLLIEDLVVDCRSAAETQQSFRHHDPGHLKGVERRWQMAFSPIVSGFPLPFPAGVSAFAARTSCAAEAGQQGILPALSPTRMAARTESLSKSLGDADHLSCCSDHGSHTFRYHGLPNGTNLGQVNFACDCLLS